jgi:uncharacterized protein YaaW (UPF0174 family)
LQQFRILLAHSSQEHRQALSKLLDCSGDSPMVLAEGLRKHGLVLFGRFGRSPNPATSYLEIVRKLAEKLRIQGASTMALKGLEIAIAEKVFQTGWGKLTVEQKQRLEEALHRTANAFDKTGTITQAGGIFAALTAAQLSGFGIYLMSSTALGFISGAVSLTMPFAVYTTVSSAIAVIIGPAGWVGAGLLAIWKLTRPSHKRLISAVVFIAMLRAEREYRLFRPVKPPRFASLDT